MKVERHIGTWRKENEDALEVAELIIEGNHIEFYRRDYGEVFPCAFIGSDGEHNYKVFTKGCAAEGKYKTLDLASSYRTFYVLQQNGKFPVGLEIENIVQCSLIIPELIDWLAVNTIEFGATEEKELIAKEQNISPIILHEANPHIEIYFESESFLSTHSVDTRTTFLIKNQPRIRIQYEEEVRVERVITDIRSLMQFFGLLIGYVSDVENIRLDIKGQKQKSWLYINQDFSYNLRSHNAMDRPRTRFVHMNEKVQQYFKNWYAFYGDDRFELIRRMYFAGNNRKDIFAEDILVQYIRVLEGYHLRINNDEIIQEQLRSEFKKVEKDIKKLIFSDEGKPIFTVALEKAVPGWSYNSKHAADISGWIAAGYLGKTSLTDRIKDLDNEYFNIISRNAIDIEALGRPRLEGKTEEIIEHFYRSIVATRNYFSHYKEDRSNVLNLTQMNNTINVIKALIIMILYSRMGMEKEDIRKIVMWDTELNFQTMS